MAKQAALAGSPMAAAILKVYMESPDAPLDNQTVYSRVANLIGASAAEQEHLVPLGKDGREYKAFPRRVRWYQQHLKQAGILERVKDERGLWTLTRKIDKDLNQISEDVSLVAYSTNFGIAILGWCNKVFEGLSEEINLILTSPPYPLRKKRKYGNPTEAEYVDWICKMIEPALKRLAPGGSICLNVSNDIFLMNSPARSMYVERLMLALHDRFGLFKMDDLIWNNPSKAPGPFQWASKTRFQLNVGYEHVLWLTNDPKKVRSNNQRVLQPHTEEHLKFVRAGGHKKASINSDGAYRKYEGSFGQETAGKIPRNVLTIGHACGNQRALQKLMKDHGLPSHGASFPLKLALFLISFLTDPGELVADLFGGSNTVGLAAELLGREWLVTENVAEYAMGSAFRFTGFEGFQFGMAGIPTIH